MECSGVRVTMQTAFSILEVSFLLGLKISIINDRIRILPVPKFTHFKFGYFANLKS